MTTYNSTDYPGDLVNFVDTRVAVDNVAVSSPAGASQTIEVLGQPVDVNGNILAAASIADCVGVIITKKTVTLGDATALGDMAVLARGPAAVNSAGLPALDYAGAAISAATYKAEIQAMGDISIKDPSPQVETQTT